MADRAREIEEANTAKQAGLLGFEYLDVRRLQQNPLYKDLISSQLMVEAKLTPLVFSRNGLTIGITALTPQRTLEELESRFNDYRLRYVLISDSSLQYYLDLYNAAPPAQYEDIVLSQTTDTNTLERLSQALLDVKPDDLLAYLVKQALRLGASDIHCENEKEFVRIRFRVHGLLHQVVTLPPDRYQLLVSSIASAANISTAAPDAQTASINETYELDDGSQVVANLRVETVPAINGMDIVMRLFNFNLELLHLDKIGLTKQQRAVVDNIVQSPTGLVLVVGPTGSGKSTTLYAIINSLVSAERKIITLEDPVEYRLSKVTQIPIDSHQGASFATGLRAVLRLDPDVLMVGEIRDDDTAKTALQAALTGHLVLSTYHASSAALALTRLRAAISENPLFLTVIRLIQAQRLVRRLDDQTKQAYRPSTLEMDYIQAVLDTLPADNPRPDLANLKLYQPRPSAANPFGFSGQLALRELLLINDQLQSLLLDSPKAILAPDIEACAQKSGLRTMLQEGILAVIAGRTTLAEIYRVLG